MKIVNVGLFILSIYFTPAALAAGGDSVGNGGDGISQLFEDAREKAVRILERLDACSVPKNTNHEVKEWLLKHRRELIDDVKNSQHIWGDNNVAGTCAWTEYKRNHYIIFSTEKCKVPYYNIERAAALLVHESIHHLGQTSNMFADAVAKAMRSSESIPTCSFDPFSEESCKPDSKASPAVNTTDPLPPALPYLYSIDIGDYRLSSRTRICYEVNSCGAWVDDNDEKRIFFDSNDKAITFPTTGKVTLLVEGPNNNLLLRAFGLRNCGVNAGVSLCTFGVGRGEQNDLYDKVGSEKQKLTFHSVFTGKCLRQYAKLLFAKPGGNGWVETEHVLFYSN